jgi:acyl-CoA synthetase (AMP-forming)/AMP-acid ligase II/aryl carrier-like protein
MANAIDSHEGLRVAQCADLSALVGKQARQLPHSPAILAPGREGLSYAGLWEQIRNIGDRLRGLGISPDDRVAVVLPNGPEMATAFLAVASCAACAPLNPAYQAAEFRFYLQDLKARALLLREGDDSPARGVAEELGLTVIELRVDAARPAGCFDLLASEPGMPIQGGPDLGRKTALILHTSGTTSRPKIVPLSHANLAASAMNIAHFLALSGQDRCLNVMPLFHIHGLVGALLSSLAGGGSLICSPGFAAHHFFGWIGEYQPTWYTAVPTIHQSVISHGAAYRRVAPDHQFRFVRSSSAALPPRTLHEMENLFQAPVIEAYGMTEASHQMASNPLPPAPRKPGSVGVPAGAEIAIMDESGRKLERGQRGEIAIRGAGVTTGYENNPEANAKAYTDGWFRTGDQGYLDDEGYLFITGRLKEIVNRGGEKISPREVDEALLDHPAVAQATAFAVPHATLGEDLAAAVVLRSGEDLSEAELREHLFGKLADFKVPSRIVFLDEIPKGPTGKIQRSSLHEKLGTALVSTYAEPKTDDERMLAGVFREVLGVEQVGLNDNFFALGGDSLRGAQVISRINRDRGIEMPIPALFQHPTIAQLAAAMGKAQQAHMANLIAHVEQLSDEEVMRLLQENPL